jgi:hypothetical protein
MVLYAPVEQVLYFAEIKHPFHAPKRLEVLWKRLDWLFLLNRLTIQQPLDPLPRDALIPFPFYAYFVPEEPLRAYPLREAVSVPALPLYLLAAEFYAELLLDRLRIPPFAERAYEGPLQSLPDKVGGPELPLELL